MAKARISLFLQGNDIHRMVDDMYSLYQSLQYIKSTKAGATDCAYQQYMDKLLNVTRMPNENVIHLLDRASEYRRMVTENGGLLDERMYCTFLRNCLDKNPVYKTLIAGAVAAGTFQYNPRVLLNICQPMDDDAVKETCDTTPSAASNSAT